MTMDLRGTTAVITGAAHGIGKALAVRAADEGMNLALADIDADGLIALADILKHKSAVLTARIDVRNRKALDDFAQTVFAKGKIALVFANAGIMRASTSWLQSAEDWDAVIDVNLKGAVNTACAFLPGLIAQNIRARLVFTGSTSAFLPRPHLVSYSCTKHALWGIAEAIELELSQMEACVRVSFLAPSAVKTGIANHSAEAQHTDLHQLLEAFGMPPDELAALAFDAIRAEKFWILPHPEFKPALQKRIDNLIKGSDPSVA